MEGLRPILERYRVFRYSLFSESSIFPKAFSLSYRPRKACHVEKQSNDSRVTEHEYWLPIMEELRPKCGRLSEAKAAKNASPGEIISSRPIGPKMIGVLPYQLASLLEAQYFF